MARNAEKQREYQRNYIAAHPERWRESQRKYRETHSTQIHESGRKYRETHADALSEKGKVYHAKNREKVANRTRKNALKRYYGLTPECYEIMLAEQGGVCKLCGNPPGKRRLDVDHDHATGQVRGLLCNKCNRRLGLYEIWRTRLDMYLRGGL
jgi:hypothetical protein